MSYEPLGGGGGQDSRLHVSDTQPDSSIVTEGDLWSKTTSNELFRATDSSTFVSTETGGAHDMDGATHNDGTHGDTIFAAVGGDWTILPIGADNTFLQSNGADADPSWESPAGGGDVTAAANMDDNTLVKGDGGAKGVQDSGATLSDSDELANIIIKDFSNQIDADGVHVQVRNESGGTLTKGTPVHISGYSVGQDVVLVDVADANGSGTMPALGLIEEDIANNATGSLLAEGTLSGLNTSAFSVGDVLYISETSGELTATRPTAVGSLVQSIGEVLRDHATLGIIDIEGAGRSNDSPNSVAPTQIILPNGATPSPTVEADIQWETDRNVLRIGDGAGTQEFHPVDDSTSDPLIDNDAAADGTEDSTARKDHVHPKHHAEAHAPESHTGQGATAAELETLTDTSDADALHTHDLKADASELHDEDHAARHADGGDDELAVQDLASDAATDGQVAKADGSGAVAFEDDEAGFSFIIDGGGSAITTGIKGDVEIPFNCTIKSVRMFADQSGSIVVDIWNDAYADLPPEDAETITSVTPPTITTAIKAEDVTLTDWLTTLVKGGWLRFNVDSVTDIERVTVAIMVDKT